MPCSSPPLERRCCVNILFLVIARSAATWQSSSEVFYSRFAPRNDGRGLIFLLPPSCFLQRLEAAAGDPEYGKASAAIFSGSSASGIL